MGQSVPWAAPSERPRVQSAQMTTAATKAMRPGVLRFIDAVYTGMVTSWFTRGFTIAIAMTMSGAPAVAVACASMCLPAKAHQHSVAAPTVTIAMEHAGHHMADAAPKASSERGLSTSKHACCIDERVAASMTSVAVRSESQDTLAIASANVTLGRPAALPDREPAHGPPVSPPSPTRSPLVLRI